MLFCYLNCIPNVNVDSSVLSAVVTSLWMWALHSISPVHIVELVGTLLRMCVHAGSKQTQCFVLTHEITHQF